MAIHHLAHPQRDLAFFRELTSIAQEIEQNLLKAHGVCGERAQVLLGFDHEAVLVLLGELSRGADDLIDEPTQVHRLGIEFELAGFDLGEVQYLVDEAQEMGAGGINTAQRLLCLSVPKRAALVTIISVRPMIALSGVRSSWLMLERNCDLF